MNFSGWVPIRRGILDHTLKGQLTTYEFAVLMALILLADKKTGADSINGPVLRTYLPGLSSDAAKRALNSLHEKGYIYRQITPRSPLVYPYWVDGYCPTDGKHKSLQLDLSEVFATNDPTRVRYVKDAPDTLPDDQPVGAPASALASEPEAAHYYEKDKESDRKKENEQDTISSKEEKASSTAQTAVQMSSSVECKQHNMGTASEHKVSAKKSAAVATIVKMPQPVAPEAFVEQEVEWGNAMRRLGYEYVNDRYLKNGNVLDQSLAEAQIKLAIIQEGNLRIA